MGRDVGLWRDVESAADAAGTWSWSDVESRQKATGPDMRFRIWNLKLEI